MNKSFLFLAFVLLLCLVGASSVSASLIDGATNYWKFDESSGNAVDSILGKNLTQANGVYGAGKINNGFTSDGTTTTLTNTAFTQPTIGYSISSWLKHVSSSANDEDRIFSSQNEATPSEGVVFTYNPSTNKLGIYHNNGATVESSAISIEDGVLHQVVVTWNGSLVSFYVDNANAGTASYTTGITSGTDLYVLRKSSSTSVGAFDGQIDELGVWNRSLSSSEISSLYNNNLSVQYPFIIDISLTAKDLYDDSGLSNFSVSWNGTDYSTTNGTVTLPITSESTALWSVSFFNVSDAGGYFNRTYTNYNFSASGNLQASLYQAVLDLDAYEKITGTQVYGNFSSGSQSNANTLYMKAGTYNITFINSSYYNKTSEFTITALQNNTQNITGVYNTIINITAQHFYDSTNITNFTGYVSNDNYSFNETYTTTTGTATINTIKNLDYNTYINATDYTQADANNYATINPTTYNLYNYTFELNKANSFYVYARDIFTNALINNVTMYLYGATTYNYTFNEELYNYSLTTGFYDAVVSSTGYSDAIGNININSQNMDNQTFYLSATSQNVVIYVRNIYNQFLSGTTVQIIRKFDNAVVASDTTDFSGAVSFNLVPTLNYYINITADGYQPYYEDFNIIESTYTITLTLNQTITPSYYTGINYSFIPTGNDALTNNTDYNFTFKADSDGTWTFTNCYITIIGMNSTDNDTISTGTGNCSGLSASITGSPNTQDYTLIEVMGTIEINNTANITYKKYYTVGYYYEGDASLSVFLTNLGNYDSAGFGKFGKFAVVFIFVIMVFLYAEGNKVALETNNVSLILIWLLIMLASAANFLTLEFLRGSFLQQWGIGVFTGLFMLGLIIMKEVNK